MPREAVYIRRVCARPIAGGRAVYDVCGETRIASTFRPWLAALCERASTLHAPIEWTWKDGRRGFDLVTARLLTIADEGQHMPHHHRCPRCQHLVPCPGTWRRNPERIPDVIYDALARTGPQMCASCAAQQAEQAKQEAAS